MSDPLYQQAVDLGERFGFVRISMIQRHLGVGYTRATQIITEMLENNIIEQASDPRYSYPMAMTTQKD